MGLLVRRPSLEAGKLEELPEQPWAKELQLEPGSQRFPTEWLKDRLKWLTESGEGLQKSQARLA